MLADEADGKRQDILIEAVPGLRLMAVLTDVNFTKAAKLDALQEAAHARNFLVSIHRVARGEEIAAAIDSAQASGATALNILASPLFSRSSAPHYGARRRAALAGNLFLSRIGGGRWLCRLWGSRSQLFSEIISGQGMVKLFRGSKVADIPVEQPTKFEFVINFKTANAMGVTVPAALVARADKVIE